jgi:hypothetical protein
MVRKYGTTENLAATTGLRDNQRCQGRLPNRQAIGLFGSVFDVPPMPPKDFSEINDGTRKLWLATTRIVNQVGSLDFQAFEELRVKLFGFTTGNKYESSNFIDTRPSCNSSVTGTELISSFQLYTSRSEGNRRTSVFQPL